MTFQVPASKASLKQNRFEFDVPTVDAKGKPKTKTFSVPKMQYISSDIRSRMQANGLELQRKLDRKEELTPEDQIGAGMLQRELFDRYAPGLYELVEDEQLNAIQEAWQAASGVTMGESSPSAD